MIHPQIEKLLVIQERDLELQKILQEIERLPNDRARIEKLINEEKASIENEKSELNAKEVQRNDLDSQIKTKESDISKFRTQQLEVKKNEEYRALSHQIEQVLSDISLLEEQEIKVMYSIDESKISFEQKKAEINQRIAEQSEHLYKLEARLKELNENVKLAKIEYINSRELVDSGALETYDLTKSQIKRPPYISAIEVQNCAGCHLRVSNEVLGMAIAGEEIVVCDQCARIVYKT